MVATVGLVWLLQNELAKALLWGGWMVAAPKGTFTLLGFQLHLVCIFIAHALNGAIMLAVVVRTGHIAQGALLWTATWVPILVGSGCRLRLARE